MTLVLDIAFGFVIAGIVAVGIVLFVLWWTDPHQIAERELRRVLRRNPKR